MTRRIKKLFNAHSINDFRENWASGLTVGLVNIPLSLALAIACGGTPIQGVITAVWAGLFSALFGGSRFNIVGPTGALAGLLMGYASTHGFAALPFLAIFVGLVIMLFYFFKWYKYIIYIPVSVIHGFTLGVAFILILGQLFFATGIDSSAQAGGILEKTIFTFTNLGQLNLVSFLIFVGAFAGLIFFKKALPKLPGAIIISAIGIVLGYLGYNSYLPFEIRSLAHLYGEFSGTLAESILPTFSYTFFDRAFLNTALAASVVAILETLISARIANDMTGVRFDRKKEIVGLSLANIFSGLAGGIPATAALARTSLNVRSGAKHFASATVGSAVVAIIAIFLFGYFKFLPLAVIAAILTNVALNMVEWKHMGEMARTERGPFLLLLLVAVLTVVEDPIVGILVGSVIALLGFISTLSKSHAEITVVNHEEDKKKRHRTSIAEYLKTEQAGNILIYRFAGEITYITAPVHIEYLEKIKPGKSIVLSFRNLYFVDADGLSYIKDMIETIEMNGNQVLLTSLSPRLQPLFEHHEFYTKKISAGRVFESATHAIDAIAG